MTITLRQYIQPNTNISFFKDEAGLNFFTAENEKNSFIRNKQQSKLCSRK